jgi:hypothetical protein
LQQQQLKQIETQELMPPEPPQLVWEGAEWLSNEKVQDQKCLHAGQQGMYLESEDEQGI